MTRAAVGAAGRGAGMGRHASAAGRRWLPVAGSLVVFLFGWQALVRVGNYPPFILPAPTVVAERFVRAWTEGVMWPHFEATLTAVLLGFAIGASFAILIGIVLARSHLVERLLSPYLVAAQATPILALAPLIALWFGTGLLSKLVICSLIVFFPVTVATMVGVRAVDRGLLEMGRSFRATPWQVITKLQVPAALPSILGGMRVGVTLSVIGAIIGEWAGAERGLGVLVNIARGSLFDIPLMFAALLQIALLGIVLYLLMILLERRLVGRR
jgi:NitT/TauT family transport system permease protein